MHLLEFSVAGRRCALPLDAVDRAYQAVELTPVAGAPSPLKGLVNIRGQVLPVISVRQSMGLADREVLPGDRLIVAHAANRPLALLVDEVAGVVEVAEDGYREGGTIHPDMESLQGVITLDGDLLVVEDLGRLSGPGGDAALEEIVKSHG